MSVLEEELSRLIELAGPAHRDGTTFDADHEVERPMTVLGVTAAWTIAWAIPWENPELDERDARWSRIKWSPNIECDISIDSDGEVNFDFDRGERPDRCMLCLVGTRQGGIIWSIMTPTRKEHGGIPAEMVPSKLAELFQHFTDG